MKSCTILILTYKGKHHLEHLLPTVVETIENSANYKIDVLIVDNGCDETTKNYVKTNFPDFRYEFSPVNDYLFSLNHFVEKINSELTFILNDDMRLHKDVLNYILPVIAADKQLFAVNCRIRDWDDTCDTAFVRKLIVKRGWLQSSWTGSIAKDIRYTLYGGGGAAVFRTEYFNALGGFDNLFRPAYCEDLDLGHRAWQMGWKIVFHPKAILFHREGGTIKDQFKANELSQRIFKNQILWMVKNGNYPNFLFLFFIMLPYRLLTGWRVNKNAYFALWKAVPKLIKAVKKRKKLSKDTICDAELLKILDTTYQNIN